MCFMLYFVFSDLVCCLLLNVSLGGVITLVGEERAVFSAIDYFFSVRRRFFFLWLLGKGRVVLFRYTLRLQYHYFRYFEARKLI